MKKFIITAVVLFVSGAAIAVAMERVTDGMGEPHCWRYKVIVEIDTPEGVKSGSAVREACLTPFKGYNPQVADFKQRVVGEAVVVDLGERGTVFAIMNRDGSIFDIENAFDGPKLFSQEGIEYYSALPNGATAQLTRDLPGFVTFDNLDDPKSIRGAGAHVMPQVFGDGVSLKKVSVEITDEPLTWGIEKWLPWLPERKKVKGYLGGSAKPPYEDPTKTYLTGVEFSRGRFWLINDDEK